MGSPRLHLVGGFLGSGKTTAIAAAAKQLIARGKRVGVVTNDQGRYLVDTLFFRSEKVPAVEVTGGCFCCNFDDFEERLASLDKAERPDVIFAESVGSCADVVATVVQPLLTLGQSGFIPTSFSVFTDSRLISHRMSGLPLPFSDDVVYIFDKQLEEAGLVVINKADLLGQAELDDVLEKARAAFPDKRVVSQDSLNPGAVARWLQLIESETLAAPRSLEDIDYDIYGSGEEALAWLDQELILAFDQENGREALRSTLLSIERGIRDRGWAIGHLKFIVQSGGRESKISFTTVPVDGGPPDLPQPLGREARLLINARVAAPSGLLSRFVEKALAEAAAKHGFRFESSDTDSFHPGYPVPVHRIASKPGSPRAEKAAKEWGQVRRT